MECDVISWPADFDTFWDQVVSRILAGLDPDGPLSKDEAEVRRIHERRFSIWKNQKICLDCQLEIERHQKEDDGFSPYLLNFD